MIWLVVSDCVVCYRFYIGFSQTKIVSVRSCGSTLTASYKTPFTLSFSTNIHCGVFMDAATFESTFQGIFCYFSFLGFQLQYYTFSFLDPCSFSNKYDTQLGTVQTGLFIFCVDYTFHPAKLDHEEWRLRWGISQTLCQPFKKQILPIFRKSSEVYNWMVYKIYKNLVHSYMSASYWNVSLKKFGGFFLYALLAPNPQNYQNEQEG